MRPPPDWLRSDRPLVWAHRGASADAPENTLAAFRLAAAQGADGVELDAQLCSTGEVVVFHDDTLGRTTGQVGLLRETPWNTLRRLDAGRRFSPRFEAERVPLLAEVFAALPSPKSTPPAGRGLFVNVELKCDAVDDRGLTAAVIRVIREAGATDRVLLSSFNPACLLRAKRFAPELPRAHLFEADARFPLYGGTLLGPLGAVAIHPPASEATAGSIKKWSARGYRIAPWTVDGEAEARRLLDAGCTGLITNRPARMRALIDGRERGS